MTECYVAPGDLNVGEWVTVAEAPEMPELRQFSADTMVAVPPHRQVAYTAIPEPGVPMRVLAVSLPFVTLGYPRNEETVCPIDTRQVRLMRLSDDYVAAWGCRVEQQGNADDLLRSQLLNRSIVHFCQRLCKLLGISSFCSLDDLIDRVSEKIASQAIKPEPSTRSSNWLEWGE